MSSAGTPATIAFGGTSRVTTAPAPTIAPSPMAMPPVSWRRQPMLMKTSFAGGQVLAELAVERREDGDRVVHIRAGELRKEGAHLGRRVKIAGVELGDDPEGFLGGAVHELVVRRARLDRFAPVHVVAELLESTVSAGRSVILCLDPRRDGPRQRAGRGGRGHGAHQPAPGVRG
jgi:hypothetical protein